MARQGGHHLKTSPAPGRRSLARALARLAQGRGARLATRIGPRAVAVTALAAGGLVLVSPPAEALPLTITVTVTQVGECCGGNIDTGSGADFYGRIWIEGQNTDFGVFEEDEDVVQPNWTATGTVDHSEDYADVSIEIFDEDSGLNFEDNQVDVSTGPYGNSRAVDVFLRLHLPDRDCDFSGDVFGNCNEVVRSFGNEGSDVGDVFFRISVSEPPSAPGLHVNCMHSPLWPQPGQPMTITASGFGDQPDGGALPAILADRLEVWYSTDGGTTRQIAASTSRQLTFSTNRVAGAGGSTFSYGCRLVDRGRPSTRAGGACRWATRPRAGRSRCCSTRIASGPSTSSCSP